MLWQLLGGLIIILIGAELFTNGIEWLGKKLNLSQSAVGSVLAAVGTALPESMIPVVAILFGVGEAGHHIGVGAILGAPFMLVTLGLALVGTGALVYRKRRETGTEVAVNKGQLNRDLGFFLVFYGLAVVAAFLPGWAKYGIALVLAGGYFWYVWRTLQADCEAIGHCPPLYLARKNPEPGKPLVILQVVLALGVIILGAKLFVSGVEEIAVWLGLSPMLVALILAPVATELPEKLNSIIWMRQNKDVMATGNMTGAMVFQSSLLPAFGMVFTDWQLGQQGLTSIGLALVAALVLWLVNRRRQGRIPGQLLLLFAIFYLLFVLTII
ncbi:MULTISPECIES: sodium:calcium antiporter [unclassified Carboxydocella]|uniref:sodium:calcium antiporter n=1 Tax=unclassified Carboxydocella TaxID=2685367 RepID=UPI0009ACB716|nr:MULTISPECIES: sodium:calcium antiporter [unclassified Carboxydocella]GAW28739.1 membrane protein [Carboxydocella sp. ULO1]GAW30584.1 membrane protein [Carboxydocella sp. JDF658]